MATLQSLDSEDESEEEDIETFTISDLKQNLELFKDNDFLTLIRIYKNRGHLFNDFYKYISSSEIIKFNKCNNVDYSENVEFIKSLNLNFSEEVIVNALENTGNHINLAIRYLLFNQ